MPHGEVCQTIFEIASNFTKCEKCRTFDLSRPDELRRVEKRTYEAYKQLVAPPLALAFLFERSARLSHLLLFVSLSIWVAEL